MPALRELVRALARRLLAGAAAENHPATPLDTPPTDTPEQ